MTGNEGDVLQLITATLHQAGQVTANSKPLHHKATHNGQVKTKQNKKFLARHDAAAASCTQRETKITFFVYLVINPTLKTMISDL